MMQLSLQTNLYLNHFPKHEKYGLCLEIRRCLYGMYGLMVEAQKRHHKKTTLTQLNIAHEQFRWFCAMAFELGYFSAVHGEKNCADGQRRYIALSAMIDEIGRMIGGWIRHALERDDV